MVAMIAPRLLPLLLGAVVLVSLYAFRSRQNLQQSRFVFVTLEYRFATFSGNGIYSMAQARALASLGHKVLVICGSPAQQQPGSSQIVHGADGLDELVVHVPESSWGSLGREGPWAEFVEHASSETVAAAVEDWRPDVIFAIDWHGFAAAQKLRQSSLIVGRLPNIFLNYRVFSRGAGSAAPNAVSSSRFFEKMESAAAKHSALTVVLARADEQLLKELGSVHTAVVPCALREDIRQLALSPTTTADEERVSLVCCVRLSPEKGALLFVQVVQLLEAFLTRMGIRPVLCAAPSASSQAYREEVLRLFKSIKVPGKRILTTFVGATELASLQQHAMLNFHPPVYDAYGMTVVEAAAFASPTVMNAGGKSGSANMVGVGAAELLRPSHGESFDVDLSAGSESVAQALKQILSDPGQLRRVGLAAQRRALEWTETKNAMAISKLADKQIQLMRRS